MVDLNLSILGELHFLLLSGLGRCGLEHGMDRAKVGKACVVFQFPHEEILLIPRLQLGMVLKQLSDHITSCIYFVPVEFS